MDSDRFIIILDETLTGRWDDDMCRHYECYELCKKY